jgi:hypothetical protein
VLVADVNSTYTSIVTSVFSTTIAAERDVLAFVATIIKAPSG